MTFKVATKFQFMHYLHVAIILFSTGLYKSVFSTTLICNFPLSLFNKSPFFVKLITQSYSILLILLLNLFLFLSTFSVFLNEYFFRWLACKSSQQIFSVNKLYYAILQHFFCVQLFLKFFKVEVFYQPGFSGPSPGSGSIFKKQPNVSVYIFLY